MLKPHHIVIVEKPFVWNSKVLLLPDLQHLLDDQDVLGSFEEVLLSNDGQKMEFGDEFIVTDINFYERLNNSPYFSLLIAAEAEYKAQLGRFFDEMWDSHLTLEDFIFIGWDVKKFLEPAVLYGFFPVSCKPNGEIVTHHPECLNQWGLIPTREIATLWAEKNTVDDSAGEIWHPVAVYADKATYVKILNFQPA